MKGKMKKRVKVMKATALYTKEYGAAAYKSYLRREEEIDALMGNKHYSTRDICTLREDNFRRMKAEGTRRIAEKAGNFSSKLMAA